MFAYKFNDQIDKTLPTREKYNNKASWERREITKQIEVVLCSVYTLDSETSYSAIAHEYRLLTLKAYSLISYRGCSQNCQSLNSLHLFVVLL